MIKDEVLPPMAFVPPTTRAGLKQFIEERLMRRSVNEYEDIPSECDTDWDEE
jgi:hypothetical protein